MVAIKNILFFITAASALTVGKRDTQTILSDISTIDSNVKALTAAFNKYNGGIFSAAPILGAESKVEDSIKQGTKDAQASSQQSSAQSQSIIAAINNLIPDIEDSLAAAEKKRDKFAADGLTPTVQKDLTNLKAETDDFADALIAIASADTKAEGEAQKKRIDKLLLLTASNIPTDIMAKWQPSPDRERERTVSLAAAMDLDDVICSPPRIIFQKDTPHVPTVEDNPMVATAVKLLKKNSIKEKRRGHYFSEFDDNDELESIVSFEEDPPHTVMNNPTAATAARLLKKNSLREMRRKASFDVLNDSEDIGPSSSSIITDLPSSPNSNTILNWLGSSPPSHFFEFARMLRPGSYWKRRGDERGAKFLSRSNLPQSKLINLRRESESIIEVEHVEHIGRTSETESASVPMYTLHLEVTRAEKKVLQDQLLGLQKDIQKISLNEKHFYSSEQLFLEDDTALKMLRNQADTCFELLNSIQYGNITRKDQPSVFQDAYNKSIYLQNGMVTYLSRRSEAQHDHQIKLERYSDLKEKMLKALARTSKLNKMIQKLETGHSTVTKLLNPGVMEEKSAMKDKAVFHATENQAPYPDKTSDSPVKISDKLVKPAMGSPSKSDRGLNC
ncbi:hypothetical protein VTL71DRAFT_10516 [Oculimacula yallundae]|uniref:Uncharacterized protein n=1 Tax=Oculimacula yallundae TaxID=86028 RepID=A0ABR4CTR5_9HELO